MTTKLYTEKSNARRAARKLGLDPDKVAPTRDGRWRLPDPAGKALAEMTEASTYALPDKAEKSDVSDVSLAEMRGDDLRATPDEEVRRALDETPPGEMPPLPPFLDAKNRPPTSGRTAAGAPAKPAKPAKERVDYRKPKSLSWEEWDAHLAAAERTKRERTAERINKLREDKGLPPVKTPRAKSAERRANGGAKREAGYKGHAAGSAAAEIHRVFDERGLDAAIEHGKGLRYNPSTVRRLAEKWGEASAS